MQRYHDVISSFEGTISYDADNRPLLVMSSNLWASGYDVDGTDQTSLGQFSGRVQQTYKHSVPRFFVPEHGTMFTLALVFFFSSRRRHTRWNCDWSSDVCSSDLVELANVLRQRASWKALEQLARTERAAAHDSLLLAEDLLLAEQRLAKPKEAAQTVQIGRASCRERV